MSLPDFITFLPSHCCSFSETTSRTSSFSLWFSYVLGIWWLLSNLERLQAFPLFFLEEWCKRLDKI